METPKDRTEAVFERIWANFSLDKAKLRSLSEKDKGELHALMRSIFMTSLETGKAVHEAAAEMQAMNLNIAGPSKEEVESTVRGVVKEELSGLMGLLQDIKDTRSVGQTVYVGNNSPRGSGQVDEAVIALHGSMFDADMKTNIDEVSVEGKEVGGVGGSLEALRRLNKKD